MGFIWKNIFAKEIWISSFKLDSIMKELEYQRDPKNDKVKVISEKDQGIIKNLLGII